MHKSMTRLLYLLYVGAVFTTLHAQDELLDDLSLKDLMSLETEVKANIGSRDGSKNVLESKAAVDVITSTQIEHSGLTSLVDVLRYFVPGFNATETSIADGTDHMREYSLRGMSPEQILVLINGKRVHKSAMLHVNETMGRGSSHVDLDTIALSSIDKVEILRDGAAAQYGSDAIAGVINISLKGVGHKNSLNVYAGQRQKGDGKQLSSDIFLSTPLQYDGFVNLTMQVKQQERTNRAGKDQRVTPSVVTSHVGVPESQSVAAVLNSEVVLKDNTILYSIATLNYRESESSTFYRDANASHQGFLPLLQLDTLDFNLAFGAKGEIGDGYYWDLSNIYGYSDIAHQLSNTMNYSQNMSSLSSYDVGGLRSTQNTTNLDMKKGFDKLNVASGLEYRYESYGIRAGEFNSYAGSGSQGFPGYKPENAVDVSRNSYAAYLDFTYAFSEAFSGEGAVRYENYSDFGETTNIKLAFSYKILQDLFLRTSGSTGFRAPSLAQSDYSKTSTLGGKTVAVAKPDSALAQLYGGKKLEPEISKHFTIGAIYQPSKKTFLMLDYFFVDVDDKIVYSDKKDLSPGDATTYGVEQLLFFTNGMDTRTQGIDIKFQTTYSFEDQTSIEFGAWYSHNQNKVKRVDGSSITRNSSVELIDLIEKGQPQDNFKLLSTYSVNKIDTTVNINRFGSYYQTIADASNVKRSYKFDAAWTVDLDISYEYIEGFILAMGGHNVFNTTPNTWDGLSGIYYGYDGIKPYSRYSPFGYSGAYYYLRATYEF